MEQEIQEVNNEKTISPNAKWYIIQTRSMYENKVISEVVPKLSAAGLEKDMFELFSPEETVISFKNGVKKESKKKLYPNYVFALVVYSEQMWHALKKISGFSGFLGDKKSPQTMSFDEIEQIKARLTNVARPKKEYKEGQRVLVKSGPFKDFYGTVISTDYEKNKINITVTIFGRDTATEMDLQDVELSSS